MKFTSVFWKTFSAWRDGVRYIISKGSTRSGKTYSNLQLLHLTASTDKRATVNSVVAMTIPHLRKGAIRDFVNILREANAFSADRWNSSTFTYTYPNGAIIEFFSADNDDKVHGSQRDRLFVNECQFIPYGIVRQLLIRTSQQVIFDYNPIKKFWVDTDIMENAEQAGRWVLVHSTYKDNQFLSHEQVSEIESNKYDAAWWQVYGEGITGSVKSGFEFYSHFSGSNIRKCEYDPALSVHVSFDFNVSPYITATLSQIRQVGVEYHVETFKEFTLSNPYNQSEHLAGAIVRYLDEKDFKGQVFIYGDASGSNMNTVVSRNNYDVIAQVMAKYLSSASWRVPRSNPRLKARREFINKVLAGGWHIKLFIDPACKKTIEDFQNVLEAPDGGKLKQRVKDSDTGMTYEIYGHTSDTLDYLMCEAFRDHFGK